MRPDQKRQLIDQLYGAMIQMSRAGNDAVQPVKRALPAMALR